MNGLSFEIPVTLQYMWKAAKLIHYKAFVDFILSQVVSK